MRSSRAQRSVNMVLNDHHHAKLEEIQASIISNTQPVKTLQPIIDMDFIDDIPIPLGINNSDFTDFHDLENMDPNVSHDFDNSETLLEKYVENYSSSVVLMSMDNDVDNTKLILNPETGLFERDTVSNSYDKSDQDKLSTNNHRFILNHITGQFEWVDYTSNSDDNLLTNEPNIKDKRKVNKKLRVLGENIAVLKQLVGVKLMLIEHREKEEKHHAIIMACMHLLCGLVNEQARLDVFNYFWSLSTWEAKKAYIFGLINIRGVIKRRQQSVGIGALKRNIGVDCFLPKLNGEKVRVCRDFFNATLDITKDTFTQWTSSMQIDNEDVTQTARKRNRLVSKPLKSESVKRWLDLLPKVLSHYCSSTSSRTYVEDSFKYKSEMHTIYKLWCTESDITPVQRKKFCVILEINKISIFKPRKDQCDTCVSYKEGNLSEEEYQIHLSKKNEARDAKKLAIASCSDQHLVATMDLQRTQLCPKLLVSSQYYKQKLQLHDFTIYKNNTKDVFLYVWHEGDGGVSANEFVSCIIDFIEGEILKGFKKIPLISDGCAHQNKNKFLCSALADISKNMNIELEQLILEKGHTMMEVDSVHSTLEKLCTPPLYSPTDYVDRMRKARPSKPYIINHLDYNFFKAYDTLPSNYSTIRPGKKVGDPTVTQIRGLLYKHGEVMYKLRHIDNWTLLPQTRKQDLYTIPRPIYTEPKKIGKSKFGQLQSLKLYMHRDYHFFYDNLKY